MTSKKHYQKCRKTKHFPQCPSYSYQLLRCIEGKVNPPTRKNTLQAMRAYSQMGDGMRAKYTICKYNPWRDSVADELFGHITEVK